MSMNARQESEGPLTVILVRHGEAVSRSEDPERPLTARGREETERTAARLARTGIRVAQIRHSGKLRARQTAEILARALAPAGGVVRVSGLDPDDAVAPLARDLERESEPVVLVGHLPHLARLASLLVCGDAEAGVAVLPTSGTAVVLRLQEGWSLAALVPPELA
jgi:phosphohistidine phosphatase